MSVAVVGKGAWGQALFSLLSTNEAGVTYWDRSSSISADSVILAIPTNAIRDVLPYIVNKTCILVNSSKGIEQKTHKLPHEIVKEILPEVSYFSLMGPSFAKEVMDNMPTLVNLGYETKEDAEKIRSLFQTDYFRVRLVEGIESIELAASFKNIYAILSGIVDGLGFGVNTQTKIILMAYEEISALARSLGNPIPEKAVAGIIGDLMLTASSENSRNYSFGKAITDQSIEKALESSKGVVEGWQSLPSVTHFSKIVGHKLVLAELVGEIAKHAQNKKEMKRLFLEYVKLI